MVKIELDIEGISWYIETTLETDTVPAVGDIIIMDKDCISERDSAELWKTPSNQVFKWADEEDDAPVPLQGSRTRSPSSCRSER